MGASCIWRPGVNKDMSGEPSALHSDLVEYTGDRDLANVIWAATRVEGLLDTTNLEYDENGEPTLESLNKVINIRSLAKKTSLSAEKREVGAINSKGNPIAYDTLEETILAINDFNRDNKDVIAYPVKRDGKYYINVEYKNKDNYQKAEEAKFNSELNNTILGILRKLGFTAIEDNTVTGIFDPTNAIQTAEGLKAVIRIAKGELGEEALPEEFCHLMIEGLQNHPLVARVLNLLDNEDAIREVLGEEYDDYANKYGADGVVDNDRMVKEAAGKLLERYIKTGELMPNPPAPKSLFQRIWSFIKSLLGKGDVNEINRRINEINQNTVQLASFVMSEEALPYFDRTKIFDAKPLYRLSTEVKSIEQIAEQGLKLASKRLKIVTSRSMRGQYDKTQMAQIKNIQTLIEQKKYAKSAAAFLEDTLVQLRSIRNTLQALDRNVEDSDLLKLKGIASVLRQIKEFSEGYSDVVDTMRRLPELAEAGKVELTQSEAKRLAELATQVSNIINNLMGNYAELRYRAVYEFLKTYWKDVEVKFGRDKGKTLTLAMILEYATKDINGVDRWINSMASASDPLLSLIDKAVKVSHAKRDRQLESIIAEIRGIHKELRDAGHDTKFMYEVDSNGKVTGNILSNINFEKFYKERRAYIDELKKQGLKYYEIKAKLEIWEASRTRVIRPNPNSTRTEIVPKAEPGEEYYIDRLSKLTKAQRAYYDRMLKVKVLLDEKLPYRYTRTYNAVQIRNDVIEGLSGVSNPKEAVKMLLGNATDSFVRRVDNTEFGEQVEGNEEFGRIKEISLDFSGNPIQKLPVYYTRRLEDMSRLSTDFTGSLLAYAGMAIDYSEMNKIVDLLEITRDLVHDRDVQQLSGDAKIMETYKILHKEYSENYTKKGGKIAERLDDYMDSVVYKRAKKEEGKITIKGKKKTDENGETKSRDTEIDVAQSIDTFKSYTGALGLGLNMFSGLSNVLVGKMQIFIEAVAGEYFGYKNALRGKINYYKLMPAYLGEINSTNRTNKLALLIDRYDALEEFYSNLRQQGKFKGPLSRLMQNTTIYILNNLGEHYLHCRTMLAILDRQKVKKNGKTITLFDAWKVVEKKNDEGVTYHELLLDDGVTDEDGNALYTESIDKEYDQLLLKGVENRTDEENERLAWIEEVKQRTDDYTIKLRFQIGRVNQALNGAFNEPDKGAIHRHSLGRMAMQFRQWMPEHYNRRFASAYYDTQLEQMREGFYRSAGRFTWELMKEARELKFQWRTRWGELSNEERRNCRRAAAELCMFMTLGILCSACAGLKDKDRYKKNRLVMSWLYQLYRMRLEVGASFPLSTDFAKNIVTILQSPAAAVKSLERFTGLVEFWNMFNEIKSGRYKGWSEYERNLVKAIPIYSQFLKFLDLGKDNYMFNYF